MITRILQQLDTLEVELSAIDPQQGVAAAEAVADIAQALRRLAAEALLTEIPAADGGHILAAA